MVYNGDSTERNERRQLIIAGGFFVLALITLNVPPGVQQPLAAGLRLTVLQPFVAMQRAVIGSRLRATEVSELRTQLDSLSALLSMTASLAEENARLRSTLALGERLGQRFVAASVIRSGTTGSESVFLLDVGLMDGVRINAPVLMQEGLLGKVIEVRSRESIAMDWSHPDFRASAMTADGAVFGMVEPSRGAFREVDRLLLDGVAFFSELGADTRIVTSGRGGVFPRGVAIGSVVALERADPRWRRSYWLRPAARPGAALHVLVGLGADAGTIDLTSIFDSSSVQVDGRTPGADSTASVGAPGARPDSFPTPAPPRADTGSASPGPAPSGGDRIR
jgi:rod shape-determining protein MreC